MVELVQYGTGVEAVWLYDGPMEMAERVSQPQGAPAGVAAQHHSLPDGIFRQTLLALFDIEDPAKISFLLVRGSMNDYLVVAIRGKYRLVFVLESGRAVNSIIACTRVVDFAQLEDPTDIPVPTYKATRLPAPEASERLSPRSEVPLSDIVGANKALDGYKAGSRLFNQLLPKASSLSTYFSQFKIWHQPKELIGGDFYAWNLNEGGHLRLALADSTGHGLEGLVGATLGVSLLNRALLLHNQENLEGVFNSFLYEFQASSQLHSADTVNIMGYEVCFLSFDRHSRTLQYISAGVDIIYMRPGFVQVLPKDRIKIDHQTREKSFTVQTIQLQAGDRLMISTDGLRDQLNGKTNRKLGRKGLLDILEVSAKPSFDTLFAELQEQIVAWQGHGEQTDDICLLAIEV
jgi:serine phosphatase RsbU (regulator of sigma subunit)